jgi:fumarylacetoacetase
VFSNGTDSIPRIGVAIGDRVFDLKKVSCLDERFAPPVRNALQESPLNALLALGRAAMRDLRCRVADLLDERSNSNEVRRRAAGRPRRWSPITP